MVKEPQAGRVKTRLGKDIGMPQAAWWFRHQSSRLVSRLSKNARWCTVLAVSPDKAGLESRVWPKDIPKWPQGTGDLGHRMAAIFKGAAPGPVVIIGADIPRIREDHIQNAFELLGSKDAVIGPAFDGGYWLIGLKRGSRPVPREIFKNVRWSTEHTLEDTLKSLEGCKIGFLPKLRDVDTVKDLPQV